MEINQNFNSDSCTRQMIYEFLKALNCPRALTVWLMFDLNEHDQLVSLEWNPFHYNDFICARDSLQATAYLSKATFLNTTFDKKKVALDKWLEAESACKESNHRIERLAFKNEQSRDILYRMSRLINNILGAFDAEKLPSYCDWGPGSSRSIKRREATSPHKFQIESGITKLLLDVIGPCWSFIYPTWSVSFTEQNDAKFIAVPKNSKTDRAISVEPGINLWFQKGIGRMIRESLKVYGLDLQHGQSVNAKRSRLASKFNKLVTVDFSSASDMISFRLVEQLFGHQTTWFQMLVATRSGSCLLPDSSTRQLEKFSAMGNGFTFELETLIFYTLALACCEAVGVSDKHVCVYGDDVILPVEAYDLYAQTASDLGFVVNAKKSYSSSYFRESCGSYWWNGRDVKPIFLREPLNETTYILISNQIRRLAHLRNNYFSCDRALRRVWTFTSSRNYGYKPTIISDGYGDFGIVENLPLDYPSYIRKARNGHEGVVVRMRMLVAVKKYFDHHGQLLSKLKSVLESEAVDNYLRQISDVGGSGNETPLPGRTRWARNNLSIPRWYDLGPWE